MSTNYQTPPGSDTAPQPYATSMTPGPVPPVAQAPRKPRKWLAWVFVLAAFLIGFAIPTGGGSGSTPEATPVTESDEYKALAAERDALAAERDALAADATEAPAEPAEEAPAEPAGLANGMFIVGTDIEPGRYSMTVQDAVITLGYVEQKDGEEYLAQEVGNEAGATIIVDIQDVPGSVVEFSGVENIAKVG